MTKSEHITGLLVAGFYYCMIGQDETADMCWRTGVDILQNYHFGEFIGDA